MPRNQREFLIRYYEQAHGNMDRTLEDLKKMADLYDPNYPDHLSMVQMLAASLLDLQKMLDTFRKTMI